MTYPDARIDTPSEAETLRDLDAVAWALDLEEDDEQLTFVDDDRGRRA